MTAPPHPAKFSVEILDYLQAALDEAPGNKVLDPFAGTGRIHELRPRYETYGIEIEQEWADMHPHTMNMDCLDGIGVAADRYGPFDAIVTSPAYGNRMADKHEAKDDSKRMTYRHQLGRPLTPGNAGGMQWGDDYRIFHALVWELCSRALVPGGVIILNISDHIRGGKHIQVTAWHTGTIAATGPGFSLIEHQKIATKRMKFGANSDKRVEHESVITFRKRAQ